MNPGLLQYTDWIIMGKFKKKIIILIYFVLLADGLGGTGSNMKLKCV